MMGLSTTTCHDASASSLARFCASPALCARSAAYLRANSFLSDLISIEAVAVSGMASRPHDVLRKCGPWRIDTSGGRIQLLSPPVRTSKKLPVISDPSPKVLKNVVFFRLFRNLCKLLRSPSELLRSLALGSKKFRRSVSQVFPDGGFTT